MTTFDEYKEKVSIMQVAEYLGYTYDKTKGKTELTYNKKDESGKILDQIVISNPNDPRNQHYFDRNYKGGDLINFIRNHLNDFANLTNQANNEWVKVNIIASHFANIPYTPKMETIQKSQSEPKELNRDRYVETTPKVENLMYLTRERMISPTTVEKFLPFITLIQDKESKGNYVNIGFPYHKPGNDETTNFEIRNHGYKGMAAGGDKENSVWIATNAENKNQVKNVIFFESAIDAMSFYELKKGYYKLADTAFVSVGGYVSHNQIENTLKQFPNARVSTGFDNDINGKLYDVLTYAIAMNKDIRVSKNDGEFKFSWDNKSIRIPQEEISLAKFKEESGIHKVFGTAFKASGEAKDFNEMLVHQKTEQKEQQQSKANTVKL